MDPDFSPFSLRQLLVGYAFQPTDESVLHLLTRWTAHIPVDSAFFLHVVPQFASLNHLASGEAETRERLAHMEQGLRQALPAYDRIFVELEIKEGNPLEELLLKARDIQADLVVLGQKNHTGYQGTLVRNLVRQLSGNCLIVPETTRSELRSILVPVDFSDCSLRAYQQAINLANCWNPRPSITILHINAQPAAEDRALEALSLLVSQFDSQTQDIRVQTRFKYAPADQIANAIWEEAQEDQSDLLITGAKGHSKLELLLLGSITEQLLQLVEGAPLLVVK